MICVRFYNLWIIIIIYMYTNLLQLIDQYTFTGELQILLKDANIISWWVPTNSN